MEKVKVKKVDLINKAEENRKKHRDIFLKALDGYKKRLLKIFEKRIADLKEGKKVSHVIRLDEPMDMTEVYDDAIAMLMMSTDEIVEIDHDTFRNIVLDKWHWSKKFTATNSQYLGD